MTQEPIETTSNPDPTYPRHSSTRVHTHRVGLISRAWHLLISPSTAFLLLFPTIGYYTLATYSNAFLPHEGSTGSSIIRILSFGVLVISFFFVAWRKRRGIHIYLLPATAFIFLYTYRLFENIFILEIEIPPGNIYILVIFFFYCVIPAYIISLSEKSMRDEDILIMLYVLSILFSLGILINIDYFIYVEGRRAYLERINAISMAYTAASFLIFYMVSITQSRRFVVEALFIVPVLLLVVSLTRSRGMIIATGVVVIIYVLTLKGKKRIWALISLGTVTALIGVFATEQLGQVAAALAQLGQDQSSEERFITYRGAWNQFLQDPLFGRYAVEFKFNFYPHNIYLESLMAVGIIGTLPLLLHFCLALRAAVGLLREKEKSFSRVFVSLLFIREAISDAFSGALWGAAGFWITSFLVIVMWYGYSRKPLASSKTFVTQHHA